MDLLFSCLYGHLQLHSNFSVINNVKTGTQNTKLKNNPTDSSILE